MKNDAFNIFGCPKCGLFQYGKTGLKTRKCPKCRKQINMSQVRIISTADNANSARIIVVNLKTPENVQTRLISRREIKQINGPYSEVAEMFNILIRKFKNGIPESELIDFGVTFGLSKENIENGLAEMKRKKLIYEEDLTVGTKIQFTRIPFEFGGVTIQD